MITLIRDQKQIVVDFSFWQQSRRERYKQLIEDAGGVWKLIYLSVHADELHRRLNIRSKRFYERGFFYYGRNIDFFSEWF
ncbi:hypothetical protein LCY76_07055 [Fictibacillus sp. KIGAM418]|uniref:Uncharacterized protein n=1 Tax=Fictibacillus marinisediminis TaxID=2878389 RepID=A0A9X1X8W8_9BACL|nr:hypothetical protein [Fictibacillus marinisediminis]MCK6256352.1 hypothetical protein [Fictibacillus marinisediminis]